MTHPNFLQPKEGLLPKHIPEDEILTMTDVHRGPYGIWVGMKGTLFCDIDGTVADLTHRRKYLHPAPREDGKPGRKDYASFERTMGADEPIHWVINAVRQLYDNDWKVIMCSGRRETSRGTTEAWLERYSVPYDGLYMRREFEHNPDGTVKLSKRKQVPLPDYRSDVIVKQELLDWARADGHDPDVVFDDRDGVVAMWRENDIPVVQVAEGNF